LGFKLIRNTIFFFSLIFFFFSIGQKKGQDISQIRGKQSKLALKDSGKNATKEDTNVQKTSTFFNLKHSRPEETVIELDKLFKKTKTIPCVYYLPVTEEVAKERKKPLK